MLGLLGIAPLVAWLGYLGAAALLGALGVGASGCPSSQSPNKDEGSGDSGPDSKLPDIGTDGFPPNPDRYVRLPDGFYSPEGKRLDIIPPDKSPDLTPSGINFSVYKCSGPIAGIRRGAALNELLILCGTPPAVYVKKCQVNGLAAATCQDKADLSSKFPAGSSPRTLFQTSFKGAATDYVIVTGAVTGVPVSTGNPIDIFTINMNAAVAAQAIHYYEQRKDVKITSGSSTITVIPTFSYGIEEYLDLGSNKRDRIFIAIPGFKTNPLGGITSGIIMGLFSKYGCDMSKETCALKAESSFIAKGRETSALATTTINDKGSPKEVLVALNSGKIDTSDKYTAGIALLDLKEQDAGKANFIEYPLSLGEVECAKMRAFPLDSTGKVAYVVCEDSNGKKWLKGIDLEKSAATYIHPKPPTPSTPAQTVYSVNIPLGTSIQGKVADDVPDMVVDGAKVYIANKYGTGRVVVVNITTATVEGYVGLFAAPAVLEVASAYTYFGCGNDLAAFDPSKVTLLTP